MELLPGKKENDGNNTTHASHPTSDEDRERVALDLKAGLHPLKVRFPPFFPSSVCVFIFPIIVFKLLFCFRGT